MLALLNSVFAGLARMTDSSRTVYDAEDAPSKDGVFRMEYKVIQPSRQSRDVVIESRSQSSFEATTDDHKAFMRQWCRERGYNPLF